MDAGILQIIAVIGVMAGAGISTLKGWWDTPDDVKYSFKKLSGAFVLSMIQAPLVIGIAAVLAVVSDQTGIGDTGAVIFVLFQTMAQGFTIDQLHTATKN